MVIREQTNFEIAIIGAGPSGSLAGQQATSETSESSIAIFEEHNQIGKPSHCSGLIALDGLLDLGLKQSFIRKNLVENEVKKARFYAPNNTYFQINRKRDSLVVLNRPNFDKYLATCSENLGSTYFMGHSVKQISFHQNKWKLLIKHGKKLKTFSCDILISAEGSRARLVRSIGLQGTNNKWLFPAIQFDLSNVVDFESDCSELYFGTDIAPGFFGWFIPLNEESARIGVAISPIHSGKTRSYLKKFLQKHALMKIRTKKAKLVNSYGGFVPASGPIKKTYSHQFMVVGDAAGQTKATTGGGVNIGGFCGRLAGKYASKILSGDLTAFQGCREYQNQWRSYFEPDLSIMKYLRRSMSYLPDNIWNDVIQIAKDTQIGTYLETTSIDLHGEGLIRYSLNPKILGNGLKISPHLLLSFVRGFLY